MVNFHNFGMALKMLAKKVEKSFWVIGGQYHIMNIIKTDK